MKVHQLSLSGTLSGVSRDYLLDLPDLAALHRGKPTLEGLIQSASERSFSDQQRELLVSTLNDQYGTLPEGLLKTNIDSLLSPDTFTVTTGHQLCLATGPLYVVYKIMSCIRLASMLCENDPTRRYVPVFWIASEDHDFEEINHVFIRGQRIEWEHSSGDAVGRFDTKGLAEALERVHQALGATPSGDELLSLFEKAARETTYARSFIQLIRYLFDDDGLIIIDADDTRLKGSFTSILERELFESAGHSLVSQTNEFLIGKGYSAQVVPRDINVFYLRDGVRKRLTRNGESWLVVDSTWEFSAQELRDELRNHPERFSPNVIYRPIYQESVLPNLAYIGGPGEVHYWLQLKPLFDHLGIAFPYVVFRDSVMLVHASSARKMEKLGLGVEDLFKDSHVLIQELVSAESDTSVETEKDKITDVFSGLIARAVAIDPTLEGAARAELQKQLTSLDQFSKRMFKAARQKEEVRVGQIQSLFNELFPEGNPQERHDNYFDHVARAGRYFHQELLPYFDPLAGELKVIFMAS